MLITFPVHINSFMEGNAMDKVEFTQIQTEKIVKELNKAFAVSVVLENELGVQKDTVSANAVCVVKELVRGVLDMFNTVPENAGMDGDK